MDCHRTVELAFTAEVGNGVKMDYECYDDMCCLTCKESFSEQAESENGDDLLFALSPGYMLQMMIFVKIIAISI